MNKKIGNWGEDQACNFLQKRGYNIEDRNFHTRAGEIDIVAKSDDTISFIEVKTREGIPQDGSAEQASRRGEKMQKMMKIARLYSKENNIPQKYTFLFEHISVYFNRDTKKVKIKKYQMLG